MTTAAPRAMNPTAQLQRIGVSQKDLLKNYKVELSDNGDKVKGETTLNWCGYRFTTEQHRIGSITGSGRMARSTRTTSPVTNLAIVPSEAHERFPVVGLNAVTAKSGSRTGMASRMSAHLSRMAPCTRPADVRRPNS
jgi:hypothetical protein